LGKSKKLVAPCHKNLRILEILSSKLKTKIARNAMNVLS